MNWIWVVISLVGVVLGVIAMVISLKGDQPVMAVLSLAAAIVNLGFMWYWILHL